MEEYVYLVFRRHMCRISVNDLSRKSTTREQMEDVKFWRRGAPIGMGSFILESKLYFAGGENTLLLLPPPSFDFLMARRRDDVAFNPLVFVYDPLNPSAGLNSTNEIPPMSSGKPHPKVAIIDGKIYLLGCNPYMPRRDKLPSPPFECYDPHEQTWDSLEDPPPPILGKSAGSQYIHNFYVMGRRIYISSGRFHFYDVDKKKWEHGSSIEDMYQSASVPFPFSLVNGCIAERNWGFGQVLVIAFNKQEGLVAYIYDPHSTHGWSLPIHHQILQSVNSRIRLLQPPNEDFPDPLTDPSFAFIRQLGEDDGKFLLVSNDFEFIQFAIFRIRANCSNKQAFVDAELLHHHLFKLDLFSGGFLYPEHFNMENALVYEHPTRKRDAGLALLDDKSFKKQRSFKILS